MNVLGTLLRNELRMLLRDRRTLLVAVGAPLLLFPLLLLVGDAVEGRDRRRIEQATHRWAAIGGEAEWARARVRAALDPANPLPGDSVAFPRFEEVVVADPDSALAAGELSLLVEGLGPAGWRAIREEERAEADSAEVLPPLGPDVPAIRLHFRGRSDFSRAARDALRERLEALRLRERDALFAEAGWPVSPSAVLPLTGENVAPEGREAGALLGVLLVPILLLFMLTGGSIVAADTLAGEKERGTLETLLTSAARRSDVVRAKMLAVVTVGLAVAVVNVLNLLAYMVLGVIDLPENLRLAIAPVDLAVLLVLLLPLTVVVAGALLLLSGRARSYKEFQISFLPLFLGITLPALASGLPGIELRSAIALVPIAGISVAVRELLVGDLDPLFAGIALTSSAALALWLARRTEQALSTERLISASDLEAADLAGGAALFPRHVVRWFAGMWVVLLLASSWFGAGMGIRGQILMNLGGIFLGGSLLMIRVYRLPVREAFALRAPHPASWIAVLIGAPSALLLGFGLAGIVNEFLFPVPRQLIERFGQELVPPDLSLVAVVFFLAVMPGVLEELAFRGVLLHGLSKRLRPWALALAVAGIFGLFHMSLFRILPTAWLGLVIAGVTLLTGSIFPAMLWHFLNNALAIVPARLGWLPETLEVDPGWTLLGAAGLAVSFWILWRTRTPYPGLRPWRAPSIGNR